MARADDEDVADVSSAPIDVGLPRLAEAAADDDDDVGGLTGD